MPSPFGQGGPMGDDLHFAAGLTAAAATRDAHGVAIFAALLSDLRDSKFVTEDIGISYVFIDARPQNLQGAFFGQPAAEEGMRSALEETFCAIDDDAAPAMVKLLVDQTIKFYRAADFPDWFACSMDLMTCHVHFWMFGGVKGCPCGLGSVADAFKHFLALIAAVLRRVLGLMAAAYFDDNGEQPIGQTLELPQEICTAWRRPQQIFPAEAIALTIATWSVHLYVRHLGIIWFTNSETAASAGSRGISDEPQVEIAAQVSHLRLLRVGCQDHRALLFGSRFGPRGEENQKGRNAAALLAARGREAVEEQNEEFIDALALKAAALKQVATDVAEEAKGSISLVEHLGDRVDRAAAVLGKTTERSWAPRQLEPPLAGQLRARAGRAPLRARPRRRRGPRRGRGCLLPRRERCARERPSRGRRRRRGHGLPRCRPSREAAVRTRRTPRRCQGGAGRRWRRALAVREQQARSWRATSHVHSTY
ncbi:unnamed protein product [Prorocentrum cordatum]|uniref:Uncharacterized protein n=1 Tax=Prorocentrum cordatum TaxID=2364126 RepID=A0ABN9TDA1_9DINO|nr:unnamed protein product [Polarella glacialis]